MAGITDVGDEVAVKKRRKSVRLATETKTEHTKQVLATKAGRHVLWEVLTLCGIYRTSYDGNETRTIYNEGRRSVGLELLAEINAVQPHAHVQMLQDAIARDEEISHG